MRYRPTPAQRVAPFVVAGVIVMVVLQVIYLSTEGKLYPAEAGDAILCGLVAGAISFVVSRDYGITLNRDEAIVHGISQRRIPRSEVAGVSIEKVLGDCTVVLVESSGRRTRLYAPMGMLDRNFEKKAANIAEWSRAEPEPGADH